ncbi:MAG: hypothetical protein FWF86_09100 [Clostridia bacterium]|nr:hypothetical protein [Clostridia bacterium]
MSINERLLQIIENEDDCECLALEVSRQIFTDDENPVKRGRTLARAYLDGDINGILNALCGWDMESLIKLAFNDEM